MFGTYALNMPDAGSSPEMQRWVPPPPSFHWPLPESTWIWRDASRVDWSYPMKSEGVFIRKFQNLHRDSIPGRWTEATMGKAPHKPLLLLCVIDSYRENATRENRVEPTFYMEEAFDAYWRLLFGTENSSTFALPFFHLQHDGFWTLVGVDGNNVIDPAIARSSAPLRKAVAFAKLDDELHELLGQAEWAYHFRSVILASNFEAELHRQFLKI